ncbi:amidohydrolase/deacetylase family metallohydrolase [Brochothrix campestris]|uniref:Dihydroorotase n=1 Tax=Brochothrix campestris FSL F6-1037 TaxID=1265861 RepID=W7D2H9_9LIST|nr:amidohydrolase/deacetylase family metallohydrolase [Brochothrix campestris]EUJ42121.1 dihydroorotase [Brochothrix campestris FSL F6-1037]
MYDLLIKNARLITDEISDIVIDNKQIIEIEKNSTVEAQQTLVLDGDTYVSAGWIDDHVHCYEKMTLYYDYPDQIGVPKGVTTVIDAGTTGAENIGAFYELAAAANTNVYALLNISKWGIVEQDELADLAKIQTDLITKALADYPQFIVGIKARMSKTVIGNNGIIPLEMAKAIQAQHQQLPLMVHVGSAPPSLADVLADMSAGDVMTHCYNGKPNGILTAEGTVKDFVRAAYAKGVIFDVGHGTDSFNFKVAEAAKAAGIICQTISTDIYHRNREVGPVYDMATTLEKMLVLGYSLAEIIPMVTANPAAVFKLHNKGQLAVGYDADLTIFKLVDGHKVLTDSNGNTRTTTTLIQPTQTIVGGSVYQCDSNE